MEDEMFIGLPIDALIVLFFIAAGIAFILWVNRKK
jgi:hypothetical protein